MLKGKCLLEYTNLFSLNEYKKNDKTILKYFQWWKSIVMFAINIENLKGLYTVCSKCGHEYKKYFEEDESIEILEIIVLIINIEEYQKIYNHIWRKNKSRI